MMRSRFLRRALPAAASAVCFRRAPATFATPAVIQHTAVTTYRFYGDAAEGDKPRAGQYLLNKADVLQRVLEVVKNFEKVDASKVTAESHFINDLGLDSLDVVEVVMALEQEFIVDISDHDAEKIQSIGDAVDYLAQNPMAK